MRVPALFLAALLGTVAVGACAGEPTTPSQQPTQAPASPAPTGEAVGAATVSDQEALATLQNYEASFEKVTTANITSPAHGEVEIWVDKAHAGQFKTVGAEAPEGMTVVKRVVSSQRTYLMKKVAGYDPANNDWYYALTADGKTLSSKGKPSLCVNCHAGYKATDYLGAPAEAYARDKLK